MKKSDDPIEYYRTCDLCKKDFIPQRRVRYDYRLPVVTLNIERKMESALPVPMVVCPNCVMALREAMKQRIKEYWQDARTND